MNYITKIFCKIARPIVNGLVWLAVKLQAVEYENEEIIDWPATIEAELQATMTETGKSREYYYDLIAEYLCDLRIVHEYEHEQEEDRTWLDDKPVGKELI